MSNLRVRARGFRRRTFIGIAVVAVLGTAAGTAWATGAVSSIVGADGTIEGCYKKENGDLRVVAAGVECKKSELALQWNEQGPQGDRGLTGATGEAGAAGTNGIDGAPGTNGTDGAPGPAGAQGATGAAGPKGDPGPAGPQGPKGDTGQTGPLGGRGPTGPAGATGTAERWLKVHSDGEILDSAGGFTSARTSEGIYLIGVSFAGEAGQSVEDCAFVATPSLDTVSINVSSVDANFLRVQTWKGYDVLRNPVYDSTGFSLAVFC